MSGLAHKFESYTDREDQLRNDRNDRLRQFITENRPIKAIAKLEALEPAYARLLVRKLVSEEGLDYNPTRVLSTGKIPIEGLTEQSERFRGRLGDHLFRLGGDRREVALSTGITFRAQKFARDRPFNYDWSISNLERLAKASDKTFRQLLLESILTHEERVKARKCGIL